MKIGIFTKSLLCTLGGYCIGFIAFGFKLRNDFDAFGIKTELKWSGIVGVLAVIPWFVLNNCDFDVAYCELISDTNDQYSVSTVIILIAILIIFVLAITMPLYRSKVDPPELQVVDPEVVKEFDKLIRVPEVSTGCMCGGRCVGGCCVCVNE